MTDTKRFENSIIDNDVVLVEQLLKTGENPNQMIKNRHIHVHRIMFEYFLSK